MKQFDVLVVGAGAAGLISALELAIAGKTVAIIEAKERCGGRILTGFTEANYPVELGAEFVHGDLAITKELLKLAGAKTYEVDGAIWQKKEGRFCQQEDFIEDFQTLEKKFDEVKTDMAVADFLLTYLNDQHHEDLRFTLQNYVEGYYAADLSKASTYATRDELMNADDTQYRIEGGYLTLINLLEKLCRQHNVSLFLSEPVWQLQWKRNFVEAITEKNSFTAEKALITVSVGVLQTGGITFSPSLPEKQAAARKLGFGQVLKINLLFKEAFWKIKTYTDGKDLHDLNFLFSEEEVPTWWTQHPKNENLLTGWLAGPKADAMLVLDESSIIEKALSSIANIFHISLDTLKQLLASTKFYNWSADPYFNGAYSYAVLNGETFINELLKPVEQTIYFAGEGLHHGNEIGTVEAALISGRKVTRQLISDY